MGLRAGRIQLIASFILGTTAGILGCQQTPRITGGIEREDAMRTVLLEHVPLGTSLKEARCFMEQEGFECSFMRNSSFSDDQIDHDYLYCDRSERLPDSWFVSRRWQIALIIEKNEVADIRVSSGLIGP